MSAIERLEHTVSSIIASVDRAPSWKEWPFAELKVSKPGDENASLHDCDEELKTVAGVLTCHVCGAEFERVRVQNVFSTTAPQRKEATRLEQI